MGKRRQSYGLEPNLAGLELHSLGPIVAQGTSLGLGKRDTIHGKLDPASGWYKRRAGVRMPSIISVGVVSFPNQCPKSRR